MKLLNLLFSTLANGVALSDKIRIIGGEEVKRFENHSYMASLQEMFEHNIPINFQILLIFKLRWLVTTAQEIFDKANWSLERSTYFFSKS